MNIQQALQTWGVVNVVEERDSSESWLNVIQSEKGLLKSSLKEDPTSRLARTLIRRYALSEPALLEIQVALMEMGVTEFAAVSNKFSAVIPSDVGVLKINRLFRKFKMRPQFVIPNYLDRRFVKCQNGKFGLMVYLSKKPGKSGAKILSISMESV